MDILGLTLLANVQPYLAKGEGELQWNIAGVEPVNVLSELQFQNMGYQGFGLRGDIHLPLFTDAAGSHRWFILGHFDGMDSDIDSGTYLDSDFNGPNRTEEYSRSSGDITGQRNTYITGSLGLGYLFSPRHSLFSFIGRHQSLTVYSLYQWHKHYPLLQCH